MLPALFVGPLPSPPRRGRWSIACLQPPACPDPPVRCSTLTTIRADTGQAHLWVCWPFLTALVQHKHLGPTCPPQAQLIGNSTASMSTVERSEGPSPRPHRVDVRSSRRSPQFRAVQVAGSLELSSPLVTVDAQRLCVEAPTGRTLSYSSSFCCLSS